MSKPLVRRQDRYVALTKEQFRERFFLRFHDPVFEEVAAELEKVFERAWNGYIEYRKSPRRAPAGPGFAQPSYELPLEWLETRARIAAAQARQQNPRSPSRILCSLLEMRGKSLGVGAAAGRCLTTPAGGGGGDW